MDILGVVESGEFSYLCPPNADSDLDSIQGGENEEPNNKVSYEVFDTSKKYLAILQTDRELPALPKSLEVGRFSELDENHEKFSSSVRGIAKGIKGRCPESIEFDDLVSEGWIGLMKAKEGFDPSRGYSFSSYAKIRIKGEMLDFLRKSDPMINTARRKLSELAKVKAELRHKLGHDPSDSEIADYLDITLSKLREVEARKITAVFSLDASIDGEAGLSLRHEFIGDENAASGEDIFLEKMKFQDFYNVLSRLSYKDRTILEMYYLEKKPLPEIGEIFNVGGSRVSQLKSEALERFKKRLQSTIQFPNS